MDGAVVAVSIEIWVGIYLASNFHQLYSLALVTVRLEMQSDLHLGLMMAMRASGDKWRSLLTGNGQAFVTSAQPQSISPVQTATLCWRWNISAS